MNLILQLSPEIEARLKEQTAVAGKPVEVIALEALQERLSSEEGTAPTLSREQWNRKFAETLAAIPRTSAVVVDDSRESIYEGRGE